MRLALAIASFVALIVHGIVFYDQFFHRWERYQTAYFDQARGKSKTDAERAALDARAPRIEQIIVTQFGEQRVDRCTTCHIGIDDPRMTGMSQPLNSHPYTAAMGDRMANGRWERRHKFADFGCTVCHEGQGRGLKTEYSHGEDEFWPEPLLGYVTQSHWKKEFVPKLKGKEYIQAACAQCHTEDNFAGTDWVSRGRKLFVTTNCYGCHRIEGLSDGTLGPDLTDIGHKFKLDYMWESVVDPRANSAVSFMPKFKLSEDDVKALVIFLKSRRGMNFAETSLDRYRAVVNLKKSEAEIAAQKPDPARISAVRGEQLVKERACLACHKLGDTDGDVAPDLTREGLLKSEQWIADHFRNPRAEIADSIMPTFRFPDEDFQAMTTYLAGLKTAAPAAWDGAQTYKELCQRCHGEKGDGHGPIAVYLDPYPRDLTKAGFINSKPVERFHDSIRKGVAGTSMPAWEKAISEEQVKAVFAYVEQAFTKQKRNEVKPRKVPETNPVAMAPSSVTHGEQIFVDRCSGCHGRKADGKGPNSLDILPRPRNLRNRQFVESVNDKRLFDSILFGVQGTAMPSWIDYGLTNNDVGDLVNFIRSINQKPARSAYAGTKGRE